MDEQNVNSLKTDIALIQKDISEIQKLFVKIDNATENMSSLSKVLAIQERLLEMHEKRLNNIDKRLSIQMENEHQFRKELNNRFETTRISSSKDLDRFYKELSSTVKDSIKVITDQNNYQNKRIESLENWKWWVIGLAAGLAFFVSKVPWSSLF